MTKPNTETVGICCECLFYDHKKQECHRQTPDSHGGWPKTKNIDWCGQWKPDETLTQKEKS